MKIAEHLQHGVLRGVASVFVIAQHPSTEAVERWSPPLHQPLTSSAIPALAGEDPRMLIVSAVVKSQGQQFLPPSTFDTCTEASGGVLRPVENIIVWSRRDCARRGGLPATLV